uniref:LTD domain-containing protein n=1 Tax=Crocodylus porosus TaxID=8502 RepID=A0A7M4F041_CROPO
WALGVFQGCSSSDSSVQSGSVCAVGPDLSTNADVHKLGLLVNTARQTEYEYITCEVPLNLWFDFYHFSALGNLRIADVHPGGYFVKILNSSPVTEESIGDYILQQNVSGQAVAVFRFPPNIRMSANSTVTVWAVDANMLHKPPSHFLWKEQNRLRTDLDCTTILCEPSGQVSFVFVAPATLFPTQNSWCRSPNSSTHPHFSLVRPLTMGNDGSSLCRQSRCQSAKPDPAPGELKNNYTGRQRLFFSLLEEQLAKFLRDISEGLHIYYVYVTQ